MLVCKIVPLEVAFVFDVTDVPKLIFWEDLLVLLLERMLVVTLVLVKDVVGVMLNLVNVVLEISILNNVLEVA